MLRTIRAAIAALLIAVGIAGAPTTAQAAGPLDVLLAGDSITQGYRIGDNTYRYFFDRGMTNTAGDLVGSRCDVRLGSCSDYADNNFDRQHFAKSGTTWGVQHTVIGAEVRSQQPDVIFVMLGVNDLRGGGDTGRGPAYGGTVVNRMVEWIEAVHAASPSTTIVVGQVLAIDAARDEPFPLNGTTTSSRIADFNRLAPTKVNQLRAAGHKVYFSYNGDNANDVWKPTVYTHDGLHPNEAGERFIAERNLAAGERLGFNLR